MSERDEYDEQSERLLPCKTYCADIHEVNCPVEYCPAVVAVLREAGKREAELNKYRLALEGLTPGGSEYVNDLQRCVEYIRESRNHPKIISDLRLEVERLTKEMTDNRCKEDLLRESGKREAELREHEAQTHELLGEILGTDDSLVMCARRMRNERDDLRREVERWKADYLAMRETFDLNPNASYSQVQELRREVERLNEKFSCGHRVVDCDDSYGECVFCKIKSQADDYENLPLTVIECHDEIADLKAKLDQALETSQSLLNDNARLSRENVELRVTCAEMEKKP